MYYKTKVLPLLIAISVTLLFAGCATVEQNDEPSETITTEETTTTAATTTAADTTTTTAATTTEETTTKEPDEDPSDDVLDVAVDNWKNPSDLGDFVAFFEEMEWVFAELDDGEIVKETHFTYDLGDTEEVNGTDAVPVEFKQNGESVIILWVDEDHQTIQAKADDTVLRGEMVTQMAGAALSALLFPFEIIEATQVERFFQDETPGIQWEKLDEETKMYGESEATVTTVQVELGPPFTDTAYVTAGVMKWSIGEFDDFSMLVLWEWVEDKENGGESFHYELKRVKTGG